MPSLTIQSGPAKGRVFPVTGDPQSIGRDGNIQLLDTAASRKHAEIFTLGDALFIRDLESRNGTYVNDRKIESETPLRAGDRIRIGASLLVIEPDRADEQPVEFVHDTAAAVASTVEIKLGDRASVISSGDKVRSSSTMVRLFTMYEAARLLGRETSLRGVLDKVLDLAAASVKPSYCYIFLRDEVTGTLVPKAWRDPERRRRRKVSRSIVLRAMQLRHSILTEDAASDGRFNQSDSVVTGEIRTVLCVPLIARDRINGVLYMGRDGAAHPFDDADLELATALAFHAGLALENMAAHTDQRTEMLRLLKTLVGAMDLRVPELRGHSERVGVYAAAVADKLRLSDEETEDVMHAALLHDIGKVHITETTRLAVSAALGQTVPGEFCHAYLGAKLIEGLPGLANAVPGIKYHHERLDGFGGPEGLSGEAVPLIARIVAVANRFDHLATDLLPGGRAMPISEALETIEQPGEGLDDASTHALVDAQKSGTGIPLPKLVLQEFY